MIFDIVSSFLWAERTRFNPFYCKVPEFGKESRALDFR